MLIRILHVLNGLGSGGAEAVVMNWYRNIDRKKVQFDFLIRSQDNIYIEEIEKYGGNVYVMPPYPSKYFENKKETEKFFQEHASKYSAIHVHGNALLYVNIFGIAKKYGIECRIYHSHSTSTDIKYLLLHRLNSYRISKLATDYFACSKAAGVWAFNSLPYQVVHNGIYIEKFKYDENIRKQIRYSLGITDELVLGNVGRFVKVKNHIFLINVFEKVVQKNKNVVLLLIGDGELQPNIKKLVIEKGLEDKVKFLGLKKNIGDYMSAMDMFLLPSLHEGLPIVAIEAQASGLPVVMSDTITNEVSISDLATFLPIDSSDVWVEYIVNSKEKERRDITGEIESNGYNIETSTRFLENYYCFKCDKERNKL